MEEGISSSCVRIVFCFLSVSFIFDVFTFMLPSKLEISFSSADIRFSSSWDVYFVVDGSVADARGISTSGRVLTVASSVYLISVGGSSAT